MDSETYAQAIDAIYAGFTATDGIEHTLDTVGRLMGAYGTTFEIFDKVTLSPVAFHSVGLPPSEGADYLAHFAPLNPRLAAVSAQHPGGLNWDYQLLNEVEMEHDPFYAEFLARVGVRYFLSAILEQTQDKLTVVTVQRTRRQGHVEGREIALMERLVPHLQRANQTRERMQLDVARPDPFASALDLLNDGVALFRRDGSVLYANPALRAFAARETDFRLSRSAIAFTSPALRSRLAAAFDAVARIGEPSAAHLTTDFAVPRADGLPPYTISLRPLRGHADRTDAHDAVTMLLVHDPLQRQISIGCMLQDLYGLTHAEAHMAQALSGGMTAVAYAKSRRVSVTTIYTHLKRTREKTGWRSVAELTRGVRDLAVTLRAN